MPVWLQIVLALGIAVGLAFGTKAIFMSTDQIVPLPQIFQIGTSLWAAFDSSKIGLRRYRVPLSYHPALVFLLCVLLWIICFPLYLFARNKVLSGKAPLHEASSRAASSAKAAKLLGFAVFCLALGGGVLFCLFAPRINPSFINNYMFRPATEAQDDLTTRLTGPAEETFFAPVIAGLQHPLRAEDFTRLQLDKPEDVRFKTTDGVTLDGWYFATPKSGETVLFSTDGAYGMRFPVLLGYINTLQKAHYSVFIYDYRKFSAHGFESNSENAITDGRAAYDYLIKERKIEPQHLILMGRDIGAYVSCQLSKDLPCAGLVLEDPWTTLKDRVDNSFALAMRMVPLSLYPGDGLDNLNVLKTKHPPVLIAASSVRDEGPYTLFDAIAGPKTFLKLISFETFKFPDQRASWKKYVSKLESFLHDAPALPNSTVEAKDDHKNEDKVGSELKWQTNFEQALATAKTEKKLLLADFFTTWCGPCKLMDSKTFTNARLQQFINEHCIAVKVDAEDAKSGLAVAEKYQVHVYPTILLLNAEGEVVDRMTGFIPAKLFLRVLKEDASGVVAVPSRAGSP